MAFDIGYEWSSSEWPEESGLPYSPPRDNPPPTCEELLAIADEMGGRDMMRFAR